MLSKSSVKINRFVNQRNQSFNIQSKEKEIDVKAVNATRKKDFENWRGYKKSTTWIVESATISRISILKSCPSTYFFAHDIVKREIARNIGSIIQFPTINKRNFFLRWAAFERCSHDPNTSSSRLDVWHIYAKVRRNGRNWICKSVRYYNWQ